MDIGLRLNRDFETIDDYEYEGWNFEILYNLVVIKQSEVVPLSMQLEASYGYTNFSEINEGISDPDQEGYGFKIGASIYREFNSYGLFSFLIGAKTYYKNYLIDTTDREEQFYAGGIGAITLKPDRWPYFSMEVEVLYNYNGGLRFVPSFIVTSPDF
jgi:hypothetical protein